MLLDPLDSETLYAAVEDAVWFSEDAGQEWVEVGQVKPGETVLTMEVHPVDSESMYAVTTGGGYTFPMTMLKPGNRCSDLKT